MSFKDKILDFFFPPKCAFCSCVLPVATEDGLCETCRLKKPSTNGEVRKIENVAVVKSPFPYSGMVRKALLRYKFRHNPALYKTFSYFMAKELEKSPFIVYDMISWIPLSRRRLRGRGYDQAQLLAQGVADLVGKPCVSTLCKQKNIKAQSGIHSATERKANISGCYVADAKADLAGKHILLVDDIITTGATMSEAAATLLGAGASKVLGLTAASTKL